MKTFEWNRHFETGLVTIDEQHRSLVTLINRLGDSFLAGDTGGEGSLSDVFTELGNYARFHFADEERLMLEEKLAPEYIWRHHAVHAQFGEQLAVLWESRDTIGDAGETLLGFLVSWLGFHILGEDRAMAEQVVAIRGGATPAQALELMCEQRTAGGGTAALVDALTGLYHVLSLLNRDLANSNHLLEERVATRTRDLADANAALREAHGQMEELARIDGLLGIANRRHFDERFDQEWRRAQREGSAIALVMIDVDHFKHYNDAHGHQAGDDCLKAIVTSIARGRRPCDLLARYGGEELVMMLPNTPLAGALKVANDAHSSVRRARIPHGASPVADVVTVSLGVASRIPSASDDAGSLIGAADRALYAAKAAGRDRVVAESDPRVAGRADAAIQR